MNFTLPSLRGVNCARLVWSESESLPGVTFAVRRVSLGERIVLTEKIRELAHKHEFLRAGDSADQLDMTLGDLLVKAAYVEWGLRAVKGLRIDGRKAQVRDIVSAAPEALVDEIVTAVKVELGLTEEERKNF